MARMAAEDDGLNEMDGWNLEQAGATGASPAALACGSVPQSVNFGVGGAATNQARSCVDLICYKNQIALHKVYCSLVGRI